jgi:hypothetical protein
MHNDNTEAALKRPPHPDSTASAGWFPVPNHLIDDGTWARLSPTAKAIFPVLMRYGNNQIAYPTQTEIGRLAGVMTTPPIRVAIADLIAEGLIQIVRRGNGRGMATEYRVTPQRGVSERGFSKHSLSSVETLPFERRNTPFEPPTKKNKKKNKKNNPTTTWPAVVEVLPPHMRTPELEQAWKRYEAHRVELRKRMSPTQAATAAERKLKGLNDANAAIDAIDNTIANGWTGIFGERSTAGSARPDRPNSRSRAQYAEPDARLCSSRTPVP